MSPEYVHETGEAMDLLGNTGKIVYVDATGTPGVNCDYTTIAGAAAYLKSLPGKRGGIIALREGQNHDVSTVVDVRGLTFKSTGDGVTPMATIRAVTGGVLQIGGTLFEVVLISVDVTVGFAGNFFLDTIETDITRFVGCNFIFGAAKNLIGSSGGPFTVSLGYWNCGQPTFPVGNQIYAASVYTTLTIQVQGTDGAGSLQFGAKDLMADTLARYDTTGQITGIPVGFLTVAPGENIQSRLDSVAAVPLLRGYVTLLPGIHVVNAPVKILSDACTLTGMDKSAVVQSAEPFLRTKLITMSALGPPVYVPCVPADIGLSFTAVSGVVGTLRAYDNATRVWTVATSGTLQVGDVCTLGPGGTGVGIISGIATYIYEAVIMVGDKVDGIIVSEAVVSGIVLDQETVGPNGFYAYGGTDNQFLDCQAVACADMTFVTPNLFWTGFVHSDSVAGPCIRPVFRACIVSSDGDPDNKYCDAFHIDGINLSSWCIYGHNNRVKDASIFLCSVDTTDQTSYLFTGVDGGAVLSNRARNAPFDATSIVAGIVNSFNCQFIGNNIEDCPSTGAGCFAVMGIDGCGNIVFDSNSFDSGYTFLTMNAGGYTACVASDIGKVVTGSVSRNTGVLAAYDNVSRIWTLRTSPISPAVPGRGAVVANVLTPAVAPGWTVNALIGLSVTLNGVPYVIASNLANTLTVTPVFLLPLDGNYDWQLPWQVGDICAITAGTGAGTVGATNHNIWASIFSLVDTGSFPEDNNRIIITDNTLKGADVGISLAASTTECVIGPNTYLDITTRLVDASTTNKYSATNQEGAGNPNSVVSGNYGDLYLDTGSGTLYQCTSYPQGTVWKVI